MNSNKQAAVALGLFVFIASPAGAQDQESIDGAVIYDYDRATKLGDAVFGTLISDLEHDAPGRNSHGGPVCLEYPNGQIVAWYMNNSDHNLDGWSEYAVSRDGGRSWDMYNRFPYSLDAYLRDLSRPAFVEAGLVTVKGTVVLFISHFEDGERSMSGFMRSFDQGASWTDYESLDGSFVGYPVGTVVDGGTNYIVLDSTNIEKFRNLKQEQKQRTRLTGEQLQKVIDVLRGPHVLYVSTNDGRTWQKRSTLPLQDEKFYGAVTLMGNGGLLAGAYDSDDEHHFYYCISMDQGRSWSEQRKAYVDKRVRDPELAYLGGRYYLHGRSRDDRFVLYQSTDGVNWGSGLIVSSDEEGPDGYSANCRIHTYDDDVPDELMVLYSIIYKGRDTNEYVFFIKPN